MKWTTANEKDNDYFSIERSNDGQKFEKVGEVKGSGTTNSRRSYAFDDPYPLSKTTYFRLRQFDFDGTSVESNIISIEPNGKSQSVRVFPNPTNGNQISIHLGGNMPEKFRDFDRKVSIINALGQTVFQQKTNGENMLQLDISTWANGFYFIKTSENTEGVKFVKQ